MTAADVLSNFNLVTTGNVSTQSDIVGDAVVGGDLSGATFFGGSHVPASPTIYVFGKLNSSLNLNSGGSLYDADASTPHVNYNGGGKHYTTLPNSLGYYTDPLTDLSEQLANLTATFRNVLRQRQVQRRLQHRRRRVRDDRRRARA